MTHLSDCAVHNEPAMPAGPCDCGDVEFTNAVRALLDYADKHTDRSPDVIAAQIEMVSLALS